MDSVNLDTWYRMISKARWIQKNSVLDPVSERHVEDFISYFEDRIDSLRETRRLQTEKASFVDCCIAVKMDCIDKVSKDWKHDLWRDPNVDTLEIRKHSIRIKTSLAHMNVLKQEMSDQFIITTTVKYYAN